MSKKKKKRKSKGTRLTKILFEFLERNPDKAYNFNQVKTLNENIPNSRLQIIKGCSHNVHLEKVDEFNESILNFLIN